MIKLYRLLILILLVCFVNSWQTAAQSNAKTIKIECNNERLPLVLKRLEKLSGYKFLFTYDDINQFIINGVFESKSIEQELKIIIGNKPIEFTIEGQYITITLKEKAKSTSKLNNDNNLEKSFVYLRGHVLDPSNKGIPGVNIVVPGQTGVVSQLNGDFSLKVPKNEISIVNFSFIGLKTETREFQPKNDMYDIIVILKDEVSKLNEVVVNGMFTRRSESFTGSATTFKSEELLTAGNQNVLKSLKNLDPSFQIMENIDFGSDPNRMPEIQMRGKTSFPNLKGDFSGNTNQPLFILDGFETTLEKVYDLDMNRIETVTLLKDAAAKAVYGSKAANGVVVIETKRPKSGELRLYYNGIANIEAPDLTGYNLMNASEKLAFERERGFYTATLNSVGIPADIRDARYKTYYDNILSGVNTYWLSQPLHVGFGQKHSMTLEGGDNRIRYQAGVYYNNVAGVMKGSGRSTFNINTSLSYSYKNLIFRNSLEFTRNNSSNSPYGDFSDYAKLNQYWRPYDNSGNLQKILGYIYTNTPVYNPLYNASLNTKSESNYSDVLDNFNVDWKISESLRAVGKISFSRQENGSDLFYPPGHTLFVNYDANGLSDRKGLYKKTNGYMQIITANAGINYNKTLGNHLIFANATWNLSDSKISSNSYSAEGFGNDYLDEISFATQFEEGTTPVSTDNHTREVGIIGAVNYSYADRYLFDGSIRTTGSSQYGSENRWGTFWSLGTGWNLHHEKFMNKANWLKQLKIRSSIGYTGSQNFSPYQALARYTYISTIYDGRYGVDLLGLPNNSLRWQRTLDWNSGFDLLINRFISARFDYYISTTNDLLSDISIPPSMGFSTYKENLGQVQNKGAELSLSITPWRIDEKQTWLTFTFSASHNENKIKKIYDIFKTFNDSQNNNKDQDNVIQGGDESSIAALKSKYTDPSVLYYEGQSMSAIWGVRSLGIDPITGNEVYLTKNNEITYIWDSKDQVVIGDTQAKLLGNIGFNAGYNGFTLSLLCNYRWGGDIYNSTLVDKVENVSGFFNLDKRILESWRSIGDVSPYKVLNLNNINYTKPTSRFVQKNNELTISSINLGYDFQKFKFVKNAGMERFRIAFSTNDLLRMTSVEIERGTNYPFARAYSLSLQATF